MYTVISYKPLPYTLNGNRMFELVLQNGTETMTVKSKANYDYAHLPRDMTDLKINANIKPNKSHYVITDIEIV